MVYSFIKMMCFLTAINIAGYSWEEADKFRKAVAKKIPEEMERQKEKFVKGAVKKGMEKEKAEELFKLIEPFSGYGFNKAHAASYGILAYQTAYMKANYTVEFMCALLTAESNDTAKIATAVGECKNMKIKVLAPDINESNVGFKIVADKDSLEGKAIRFGLSAIKNVGRAAIEAILEVRAEGEFTSFVGFCAKVDSRRVNKKVLESLIKVGALSSFGKRSYLLSVMDEIRAKTVKPKGAKGQQGLFGSDEIKERKNVKLDDKNVSEFSQEELQTLERQLLGFSLSARPLGERVSEFVSEATHKIFEVSPRQNLGEMVRVAAVVSDVRIVITKRNGQEMAFVKVEDETGTIDLVVFPKIFSKTKNFWIDNIALLITGRVDSREDSPTLIVESIHTKDTLKEVNKNLFIKIPKGTRQTELEKLRSLLLANSGDQSVTMVFEGNNSEKIKLPFKINWNETLAYQISEILE